MTESIFNARIADLKSMAFREDFLTELYDVYQHATAEQRTMIWHSRALGSFGPPKRWRNPADYDRTDLTREQRLRQSLFEWSINDGSKDCRDDLTGIAFCYHNLALMGIDADRAFEEVAMISSPRFSKLLKEFIQRPPAGKSLEAWGLRVEQSPDGPVAVRIF